MYYPGTSKHTIKISRGKKIMLTAALENSHNVCEESFPRLQKTRPKMTVA